MTRDEAIETVRRGLEERIQSTPSAAGFFDGTVDPVRLAAGLRRIADIEMAEMGGKACRSIVGGLDRLGLVCKIRGGQYDGLETVKNVSWAAWAENVQFALWDMRSIRGVIDGGYRLTEVKSGAGS